MGDIFGVAKISNIFLGVFEIPDIFGGGGGGGGVNGRYWAPSLRMEKIMRVPHL